MKEYLNGMIADKRKCLMTPIGIGAVNDNPNEKIL
jgi:hypothetical protein